MPPRMDNMNEMKNQTEAIGGVGTETEKLLCHNQRSAITMSTVESRRVQIVLPSESEDDDILRMDKKIVLPGSKSDDSDSFQLQPLSPIETTEILRNWSDKSARRALGARPKGVRRASFYETPADIELVEHVRTNGIIFWPWNPYYRVWWHLTVLGATITAFLIPYQIAFEDAPGVLKQSAHVMEKILSFIFTLDIFINFNLVVYKDEEMIFERQQIAREYFSFMFWVDLVGIIPFDTIIAPFFANQVDASSDIDLMLSLLRLPHFVRLHRIRKFSSDLRYNARMSLLTVTLLRDFAAVVITCHVQGCCMYFLARLHKFSDETWLGPIVHDSESSLDRYVTSIYWSITTFCTVGYGDFSPVNPAEKIAGSLFMLLNIVIAAWIIGSITLLMLTGDEKTREYRDSLETLHQYGEMHNFDQPMLNKLKQQLKLEFNNREIADEQVLKYFPSAVRRKILRRLYKNHLTNTQIMRGVRPQFVDAFLASCTVEIFSPGEEIVERGSILSDLFLVVGGIAEFATDENLGSFDLEHGGPNSNLAHRHVEKLEAGDFIGEIGFFTESPQIYSVVSVTVCKTLTMSHTIYKSLTQDHPGSVGKILKNLLTKMESNSKQVRLPKSLSVLTAGSVYDDDDDDDDDDDVGYQTMDPTCLGPEINDYVRRRNQSLTDLKDLVKMHLRRNLDDETTRLLFAASRGDTSTISLMCDHGFDVNNADYDNRTALMVASMKGNSDVVRLLLQYGANPNKTDMHGSTALLEATKNGHDAILDLLFQYKADLCLPESLAASILCQAVFDGDILLLKRLLKAGIDVNSSDYDKRSAAHIAAAEGNVAAIRILKEHGADLTLTDRWGNTVQDEARKSNTRQLIAFMGGPRADGWSTIAPLAKQQASCSGHRRSQSKG